MFENTSFIKPDFPFEREFKKENLAPMFRKKFFIEEASEARLYICALGFGICFINGRRISGDLFASPVSDYNKTLWYNMYDVSEYLQKGENIIAVICGNGWFNEEFVTAWDYHKAAWRDNPKLAAELHAGGRCIVRTDESWLCKPESAIWFNALRSGEYFDANKYEPGWKEPDYDDSGWKSAVIDNSPPKGVFRECLCEPVHECEIFPAVSVKKTGDKRYVFDIAATISGYIRITAAGNKGDLLTIRYAERLNTDGSLNLNNMDAENYYKESEFQTDKLILSGKKITWSPMFSYHGFRYIEIDGLENPDEAEISGVFVHQDIKRKSEFHCSDELFNKIFDAGIRSTYSNMFYMLTDCPTREKLGWTNDAQSSAEQVLTDFRSEKLLEKWLQDIYDAMREDGCLPGTIPTAGWEYDWGNGPVSDGVIFEIPYRLYRHTGNTKYLTESLEYFEKYFEFLKSREENGFVKFGLNDWARPGNETEPAVPAEFINAVLIYNFYNIAAMAADLSKKPSEEYKKSAENQKKFIIKNYIEKSGKCTINRQTAVSLLIYFDVYDDLQPLKNQLAALVEKNGFRHDCGMVGMRRILHALDKCSLSELAFKIATADGFPSYRSWFDKGADTLWEYWDDDNAVYSASHNHHMYSDVMSWMIKTILGIRQKTDSCGFSGVELQPFFFEKLEFAKGYADTACGKISVEWKRTDGKIALTVNVPEKMNVWFSGKKLNTGENKIEVRI